MNTVTFSEKQLKNLRLKRNCGRVGLVLGWLAILGSFGFLIYSTVMSSA